MISNIVIYSVMRMNTGSQNENKLQKLFFRCEPF